MRLSHERRPAFSTAVYFLMLRSRLSCPPLCKEKKHFSFTGENRHSESPLTGIFSRRRMLNHLDICVSLLFWETFNRVCSCYFFFRSAKQLRLFTITRKMLPDANIPQTMDVCVMELIALVLLAEHLCKLFLLGQVTGKKPAITKTSCLNGIWVVTK